MFITYANWSTGEGWSVFRSAVNWPVSSSDLMKQRTMSDWLVPGTQDEDF